MTEPKEMFAHPILGFHILKNQSDPTVCVIAFLTDSGPIAIAMQKGHAEAVATALAKQAEAMPARIGRA